MSNRIIFHFKKWMIFGTSKRVVSQADRAMSQKNATMCGIAFVWVY